MNDMHEHLITQIDLLESQSTQCLPWKSFLDQVISDMSSIQTPHENDGNQLYQSLVQQNKLMASLVLVSIIAGMSK